MKKNIKELTLDLSADILGSFLLSAGIYSFIERVNVAPGGVSGIAIMAKYLWGLPVGLVIFVANIPLLFLAYRYISKAFALRSVRTLIFNTTILDYVVTPFFPQYVGDRMLGTIFGGIIMGLGLGVIFLRGSSTAGTDILSHFIERRFPHIQIGKAIMIIDSFVLALSVLVFKNIESALFGVIAVFCQTVVIDKIVYSTEKGRNMLIISEKSEKIAQRIMKERDRGATFLNAEGAYSKKPTKVLMCVIRVWEYHHIKQIVYNEDPNAFLIASVADQIMGEGFSKK